METPEVGSPRRDMSVEHVGTREVTIWMTVLISISEEEEEEEENEGRRRRLGVSLPYISNENV